MITGNSLKVYMGLEKPQDAYGTKIAAYTHRIKVSSEGLQAKYNKKDEGLLTGGIATGKVATMSRKVEGSLSTLLRPDDAGLLFYLLCGKETTVMPPATPPIQSLTHTFVPIGNDLTDSLPSCTVGIDRTAEKDNYTGCKLDSASFSAQQEDYVKLDLSFVGAREIIKDLENVDTLKPSAQTAFKFLGGEFKIQNTHVADVTSIKFDYNNSLDANTMTTDSGEYFLEPECGARDIKIEIEVLYSKESAKIKKDRYANDDEFSVSLHFESSEKAKDGAAFKVDIEIPAAQLTELTHNVGGSDKVVQKMSMKAVENFEDPLISVKVHNNVITKYGV